MKISDLYNILPIALKNNLNIMILGMPGCGKSDTVKDIVENVLKYDFITLFPALSSPIDFKGLPVSGTVDGKLVAEFIPYGDLNKILHAEKELVVFLDEIGQAPVSVQSATLSLILAREVNGVKISPHVRFIAATNDKTHNAGVSGLITPLLSRFASIINLEVDSDSWINWAIKNNICPELISYIKTKPSMLSTFDPKNKSIANFACPRTVANLGKWINLGIINHEIWSGCVGEAFSVEFMAYYKICSSIAKLPGEIISNPYSAEIPTKPDILYFVLVALANKAKDEKIFSQVLIYAKRLPKEYEAFIVKMIVTKNPKMKETKSFIDWHVNNQDIVN